MYPKKFFWPTTTATTIFFVLATVQALDNGHAQRPPMGWRPNFVVGCQVDCVNHPIDCVDEQLFRETIDQLVEDGYVTAGYDHIQIDDCWMADHRDPSTGRLISDPLRFANDGVKAIVKYGHKRDVYVGIYQRLAETTGSGKYPGTFSEKLDHIMLDAKTFVEWNFDAVNICGNDINVKTKNVEVQQFHVYSRALNETSKKPILFECCYQDYEHTRHTYAQMSQLCNVWRGDSLETGNFQSILKMIDTFGKYGSEMRTYHRPGSWASADDLLIGHDYLTIEQAKTQMAFWCMWSAPLYIGSDIRTMLPEFKQILLNKHLIQLDQDELGDMAVLVHQENDQQVWVKRLQPERCRKHHHSYAVLYFNRATGTGSDTMEYQLHEIIPHMSDSFRYQIFDLFDGYRDLGLVKRDSILSLAVHRGNCVRLVKIKPECPDEHH